MSTSNTLFMRTYARKRRKLTVWISPKKHEQAFDSSSSSESDESFSENDKIRRRKPVSVAAAVQRRGRDKRYRIISESEEERSFSRQRDYRPPQTSKGRKGSSKGKSARPTARRKAKENALALFRPQAETASGTKVPASVTITPKKQHHPIVGEPPERDLPSPSAKSRKNPLQVNTTSNLPHPLLGRNVTRRRGAVTARVKVWKAKDPVANSFDDLISEEEIQICRPDAKKMVLLSTPDSSAENSASNLDGSLGPPPRKPTFCSTPSASPRILAFPVTDQSPKPASVSVGRAGASLRPEDRDSPCSPPPIVHHSDKSRQSSGGEPTGKRNPPFREGHWDDLFTGARVPKETSGDRKLEGNGGPGSERLLTAHRASDGGFLSTVEGLRSLTEVLKEKCLSQDCSVQVRPLDGPTVAQTARSSCLGDLSRETAEPLSAERSYESHLAAAQGDAGSRSGTDDKSDSETSDIPVHLSLSAEIGLAEASTSSHAVESAQRSDGSFELFTCAQLTDVRPGQILADDTFEWNEVERSESEEIEIAISQRLSHRGRSSYGSDSPSGAESLSVALVQKCRRDKVCVRIKRLTPTQLKEFRRKGRKSPSRANSSGLTEEDLTRSESPREKKGWTRSGSVVDLDKEAPQKCWKVDRQADRPVAKKKTKTSLLPGPPGAARKACVSGLSVSRWKNDSGMRTPPTFKRKRARRAGDGAVDRPTSAPRDQVQLVRRPLTFRSPRRTSPLEPADFTPRTRDWNRLKAALSVHRKVLLTPQTLKKPKPADNNQLAYDADLSDAEKVYAECGQRGPLPWNRCLSRLQMKACVKIGEGTFGEVFSTSNPSGETVALKVIPLEGSEKVNGEDQKTFGEVLHEIIISKELSSLKAKHQHQNQTSSFIGLNDLHCVRGRYPPEFLKAWDAFDRERGSENDRPDFFENDQLYIMLEFEFGGVDLESSDRTLPSLVAAKSILHQVTAALAVAEQQLRFEHRDLHWGNVLVKTTKQKSATFLLNGEAHSVDVNGVLVRIIDYSLSRLEIDGLTVSCDISDDEELFLGRGDRQFDVYRLMREENGNEWEAFHPHSNVLWLHYLCSKLLSMKFRRAAGKAVEDARKRLTFFRDRVLRYASATEALRGCSALM
ncbi:uncharacterized protein haspin isoform X2 [Syngnathoides biaculeatus]|uniref:uncharacterized protein haspin isoform X2 n=1 Tax=Syngnathoides biaculeatus TaxID=300417 RepID=UPI002ADE4811|nr:uncharacterized protein haspin isoform X2 [Syngnathoides biaculeatus]